MVLGVKDGMLNETGEGPALSAEGERQTIPKCPQKYARGSISDYNTDHGDNKPVR